MADNHQWTPTAVAGWHKDCRAFFHRPLNAALIAEMEQTLAMALQTIAGGNCPDESVRRAIDLSKALEHAREVFASWSEEEEVEDVYFFEDDDDRPTKRARHLALQQ